MIYLFQIVRVFCTLLGVLVWNLIWLRRSGGVKGKGSDSVIDNCNKKKKKKITLIKKNSVNENSIWNNIYKGNSLYFKFFFSSSFFFLRNL